MSDDPFKYWVSEWDGVRTRTGHGGGETYAEARTLAVRLSEQPEKRDRGFQIVDPQGNTVAVAMNGEVTNPDGNGPDVAPGAWLAGVRFGTRQLQAVYMPSEKAVRVYQLDAGRSPEIKAHQPIAVGAWRDDLETFVWQSGVSPVADPVILNATTETFRARLASEHLAEAALAELKRRNVSEVCPRCRNTDWTVESFGLLVRQDPFRAGIGTWGEAYPQTPVVAVTCQTCGWMALHSLSTLGVRP